MSEITQKRQSKLFAASSPHIFQRQTVQNIMLDVVIALIPAAAYGVIQFGVNALLVMLASVASAIACEALTQWIVKKPITIYDCSAIVSGMLIGMGCPPDVPVWVPVLGSAFAMIVVKQMFGGLASNFVNAALTGRAFMVICWPDLMTKWTFTEVVSSATSTTQATPLEALHYGEPPTYGQLFFGDIAGTIGEVCKVALLVGGLYLLLRKVIRLHGPVSYIGTVFLLTFAFGGENGLFSGDGLYAILAGGVIMAGLFMVTDYSTAPITGAGQIIFGIGAGLITFLIRQYGSYPEGVTYALLLMNILTPLIDRITRPKLYGEAKKHGKNAKASN
ncbi:RnfABCDGE type electron transport complex subunit D [Eubacteriales bacterium OttesenSCG-928-N14]|nr:RnfABCDGE type electron transport complex subunit D [Eubacteriales bacterium OttesenSCG-928-N14]